MNSRKRYVRRRECSHDGQQQPASAANAAEPNVVSQCCSISYIKTIACKYPNRHSRPYIRGLNLLELGPFSLCYHHVRSIRRSPWPLAPKDTQMDTHKSSLRSFDRCIPFDDDPIPQSFPTLLLLRSIDRVAAPSRAAKRANFGGFFAVTVCAIQRLAVVCADTVEKAPFQLGCFCGNIVSKQTMSLENE